MERLQIIVIGLAVTYVLTFLSGFLQATQFNFLNYVFFLLLFIGGLVLTRSAFNSDASDITRAILYLTALSSPLLFILFVFYELFRLNHYEELAAAMEALLYLGTLSFWILIVASLVVMKGSG
jgi:hypothetical protein